jgi:hypothetical protein
MLSTNQGRTGRPSASDFRSSFPSWVGFRHAVRTAIVLLLVFSLGCGRHELPSDREEVRKVEPHASGGVSKVTVPAEQASATQRGDDRLFERLQYSLLMETDGGNIAADYDDDQHFRLALTPVGGRLIVYVNDSPARLHCGGSSMFPIFDLVAPGKNRIRVEGKHPEKMLMKAVIVDPQRFNNTFAIEKVLAKTWLDPTQESVTMEFDAELTKRPDYEELPNDRSSHDRLCREARTLVEQLAKCCDAHDGEGFFRLTMPDLKSPPPYLGDWEAARRSQMSLIARVSDTKYRLVTRVDDVQVVVGKRSVLVFTGVTENEVPYLFQLNSQGESDPVFVSSMRLMRLEGQWIAVRANAI